MVGPRGSKQRSKTETASFQTIRPAGSRNREDVGERVDFRPWSYDGEKARGADSTFNGPRVFSPVPAKEWKVVNLGVADTQSLP